MAQANRHSGVCPNTRDQIWLEHLRTYREQGQMNRAGFSGDSNS